MTDLNKERELYESVIEKTQGIKMEHLVGISFNAEANQYEISGEKWACELTDACEELNTGWFIWQECVKAKAQAVPEHIVTLQRNGEVFKFDLLDLLRRSLKSSKVLKTRENWSHVSKMIGIGSTTSTLLCKAMKVDPDGTVFEASESGAEG
ncbi:hypothetical protein [Acinetobacter sp. WSY_1]|uniref:hypothetical protein n=1 Tax=Acinetobacter sp. WSY_1 TaxID=3367197 RepID=UPI00370B8836